MAVVKADGYGHGMRRGRRAAARAGGADWLGVATIDEALALRAAGDTGRVLCWLAVPGDDYAAGDRARRRRHGLLRRRARRDRGRAVGRPARVQLKVDTGLSRGGAPLARLARRGRPRPGAARRTGTGRSPAIWSHFACSDEPDHPANDAQEARLPRGARRSPSGPGCGPRCATSPTPPPRSCGRARGSTWSGAASRRTASTPRPASRPTSAWCPAMTARARWRWSSGSPAGAAVSYGHTWVADRDTTLGLVPVGYADGVPRAAGNRAEVLVGGRRRPVRGRICMDQFVVDLDGDDPARRRRGRAVRPRRRTASRPPRTGPRPAARSATRSSPGSAAGCTRRYVDSETWRAPTTMSAARVAGPRDSHAGAVGLAAAGAAVRSRRPAGIATAGRSAGAGDATPFGSLRSRPVTVVADDGVPLHVEVDELDGPRRRAPPGRAAADRRLLPRLRAQPRLLALPARRRTAARSARSSTTSARTAAPGRSTEGHATIDQLGHDLRTVLEHVVPEGPVVLVGHSMGGMTIIALAEQHPELFGDRVVGVALISTTAGGLDPSRILLPMLPAELGGELAHRAVADAGPRAPARRRRAPARPHGRDRSPPTSSRSATTCRRRTSSSSTDALATPFEVVAEFFPSFRGLDKFDTVERSAGCRPRSSAAPRTSSPRSGTAASCTRGSRARRCSSARRRPHGDHRAARPGQRGARPAARRGRRAGRRGE